MLTFIDWLVLFWVVVGLGRINNLAFFLPFHPPVLKPNFNLSFCKAESVRYFNPPPPGQVSIEMEFFLQF